MQARYTKASTVGILPLLAVCTVLVDIGRAQQKAPTGEDIIGVRTDYELPPASLEIAWQRVPLIARVTVRASHAGEARVGNALRLPVTNHTVEVLEVLKGTGIQAGAMLTVSQAVGTSTRDKLQHKGGGRVFKPNDEYVLFLERAARSDVFGVAWGSGGAYHIVNDAATVPAAARRMWQYRDDLHVTELLSALRDLRSKGK